MKNANIGSKTSKPEHKKTTVYPLCLRRWIKNKTHKKMILFSITLTFK